MGTNFYAILPVKKVTKDRFYELAELIDKNKVDLAIYSLYDLSEELKTYKVHLGKRSYGWAFLWDLNELKYYGPELKAIEKFIKDNKATIEDEYGNTFTWDQFINDEIGKSLHIHTETLPNGEERRYDSSATYKDGSSYYMFPQYAEIRYKLEAYEGSIQKGEFITPDNIRFALFTDFS